MIIPNTVSNVFNPLKVKAIEWQFKNDKLADTYGKIAYDTYCTKRNWKAYNNTDLPQWDVVAQDIKDAWSSSALAVLAAYTGPLKPTLRPRL